MSYKASLACAGAFAAAASLTGTAFAADLSPPPPHRRFRSSPGPASTLAGRSATPGAKTTFLVRDIDDDLLAGGTFSHGPQGVIGGGHVGYNLQHNQWLVLGLEASVDGTSFSNTLAVPVNDFASDTPGSITATDKGNVQGSLRGRLGIAFDRVSSMAREA